MRKKIITAQFLAFWMIATAAYSQALPNPIELLLNYKTEKIKFKHVFSEENQLDKYRFEISKGDFKLTTGDNQFYQLKNKKSKRTKPNNVDEFFNYINKELSLLGYKKIYSNKENRIFTYRKRSNFKNSFIELYYEDDQLSLVEMTLMKDDGMEDFKNTHLIYKIESSEIDSVFYGPEVEDFKNTILVTSKGHREEQEIRNVSNKDSLLANYHIEFNTGKLTFQDSSMSQILSLAATLKSMPNRKFIVAGNTSSTGGRSANYILSKNRAEFICKVLINYFDINQEQLLFKGNGEDFPLYDNDSEQNRILNRRIDLLDFEYYNSN